MAASDNDRALALLQAQEAAGPVDGELLWRLGRAHYLVGENASDRDEASRLSTRAHEYVAQALAGPGGDEDPNVNKWAAITLGRLGDFSDTTSKIKNSFLIKEYALKAQKLKQDPTVSHILGRWCFSVAGISFVERTAASVLFASPPTATYEEAVEHFLEHEKLMEDKGGGMIRNKLFLGDSYLALGKKEEAAKWFKLASEATPKTDHDRATVEEAAKKLKSATSSSWW